MTLMAERQPLSVDQLQHLSRDRLAELLVANDKAYLAAKRLISAYKLKITALEAEETLEERG